ncbi:MAG: amino acid adenylation domain-containing protein [Chloroflexota bacterium]
MNSRALLDALGQKTSVPQSEDERLWDYWREQLSGELPLLNLPTDHSRLAVSSYTEASISLEISTALTQQLRSLAQDQGVTEYMLLLAAFQLLLHRYTDQDEILVGSPVVARDRPERTSTFDYFTNSYFTNVVVMRANLAGTPSFTQFLQQVRSTVLGGLAHQDFLFSLLVERLQKIQTTKVAPIYQAAFALQESLQNNEAIKTSLPLSSGESPLIHGNGLEASCSSLLQCAGPFDLFLELFQAGNALVGSFKYNADLFEEITIQRMAGNFQVLLGEIVKKPTQSIAELPMLTKAERHQLLVEWNASAGHPRGINGHGTVTDYPKDKCVHQLFEEQVARTPDAVAVVFDEEQLTYRELNERANQLAHYLRSLGVGPEKWVGICIERSLEIVVALLGTLKAGSAYIPIDPEYPSERIALMLKDATPKVVLTQETQRSLLSCLPDVSIEDIKVIYLDTDWDEICAQNVQDLASDTLPEQIAYIIYTSGSTGTPKGVLIPHRGLSNLILSGIQSYGLAPGKRLLQLVSFSFDPATFQIGVSLCSGATLYIADSKKDLSEATLLYQLQSQRITHAPILPSLLSSMAPTALPDLEVVITGGDVCPWETMMKWAKNRLFINEYGPTETTVCATMMRYDGREAIKEIYGSREKKLMIGQPIANVQTYVVDEYLQPVPIGVSGELLIGGIGLARGYHNQPGLTNERFIEHPQWGRLYRTGDLCRWRTSPDASPAIEFLGRADHQVKMRGFRIELGEIERTLLLHDNVREAVVVVHEGKNSLAVGNKQLVAYLVRDGDVRDEDNLPADTLRQHLAQQLPEYMIPSAFVLLDAMPLTPNDKIDRDALPAPEYVDTKSEPIAPRNKLESSLAQTFADILGLPEVGIHDNFFRLGGDSILSIQVASRAAQQGYAIRVNDIFQYPTVAELVTMIDSNDAPLPPRAIASQGLQRGNAPMLPIQRWFLDANQPEMHHFNQSFLLTLKQPIDLAELETAVHTLIGHHDALRFQYSQVPRQDSRDHESGWSQHYLGHNHEEEKYTRLEVVDLSDLASEECVSEIERIDAQAQASLNPLTGDLVRFVYFKTRDSNTGDAGVYQAHLLIVIHHLAVDGVSWRILLEDLTTLLEDGQIPPKTSSYRDWVEALQSATQKGYFDEDINYWLADVVDTPLRLDDPDALNTIENSHHLTLTLTKTQTDHLLHTLPNRHDVTLDAVVLTALTETLTGWLRQPALSVQFESYGRQELFDTINLNRTIGWFTAISPLTIPRFEGSAVRRIRYTLEQLRAMPDGGISFGALRYFHPEYDVRTQFEALPVPQVVYNYLGQLDGLDNDRFGMDSEPFTSPEKSCPDFFQSTQDHSKKGGQNFSGHIYRESVSPRFQRDTVMDSNAVIINGHLSIHWIVGPQFHRKTAEFLLDTFKQQLSSLITEALKSSEWVPLRSDFPDVDLSLDEFEALTKISEAKTSVTKISEGNAPKTKQTIDRVEKVDRELGTL